MSERIAIRLFILILMLILIVGCGRIIENF